MIFCLLFLLCFVIFCFTYTTNINTAILLPSFYDNISNYDAVSYNIYVCMCSAGAKKLKKQKK